jgi:hypothetical protein
MRFWSRKTLRAAGSHDPLHHVLQFMFLALVLGAAVIGSTAVVTTNFKHYLASSPPHGLAD